MKEYIVNILIFLIIISLITLSTIWIYNSRREERVDIVEKMAETAPQEENTTEEDILVTEEYEINGTTYEVIAVLKIPSLEIEYPVFSTTSKELLKVSLNKYWGPNPNKKGNLCILGHNYNDSRFFGKLHKIQIGDIIQLRDMTDKTVDYAVYDTYVIDPDDTDCTSQLTEGRVELTLITCTATGKQRFVVKARAEE